LVFPSFNLFILPDVPADGGIPLRNLSPRITFGDSYFGTRPESDVEARNSISVRFVTAIDASEDAVAFPIFLAHMPTAWARLRSVVGLYLPNGYAFPFSYTLQGVSEEAVWDAVGFPSTLLTPFVLTLPEVSKPFDGDVSVELLCELNDFICYLPRSGLNVVSLFSAGPLEFKPGLAPGNGVSILLEFGSSLFKKKLSSGDILSVIGLPQDFLPADYGYGDLGAVDIYTQPIRSYGRFRCLSEEDGEEPEVPFHDYAGQTPTVLQMPLKALVGSVLAYGESCSLMVESKAEDGVASLRLFEAEESSVEADDTFLYFFVYGFSDAPCVACSLDYQLGCYTMLASEAFIGFLMELPSTLNAVKRNESFIDDVEKGSVGFSEKLLLSLCWLKDVQRQTLLHVAIPKFRTSLTVFIGSDSSPRLKSGASSEGIL
jgi:hypothetical protein